MGWRSEHQSGAAAMIIMGGAIGLFALTFSTVAAMMLGAFGLIMAMPSIYRGWFCQPTEEFLNRSFAANPNRCPRCEYDLSASASQYCPECGWQPAVDRQADSESPALHKPQNFKIIQFRLILIAGGLLESVVAVGFGVGFTRSGGFENPYWYAWLIPFLTVFVLATLSLWMGATPWGLRYLVKTSLQKDPIHCPYCRADLLPQQLSRCHKCHRSLPSL